MQAFQLLQAADVGCELHCQGPEALPLPQVVHGSVTRACPQKLAGLGNCCLGAGTLGQAGHLALSDGDTALGRERKMTGLSCPSSHQRNRLRSEGTLFKPDDRAWRRLLTQCSGYGSAGPTGAACSKSSAESAGSGGPAGRLSGRLCRESSAGPAGRRSADFAEKLSSAESAGCLGRSGRFCSGPNGLNTKMLSTTGPPNLPPSRPHLLTSVGFPSRKTRLRQIDAKRPRHGEGWYPPPGTPRSKHANPCDCAAAP